MAVVPSTALQGAVSGPKGLRVPQDPNTGPKANLALRPPYPSLTALEAPFRTKPVNAG